MTWLCFAEVYSETIGQPMVRKLKFNYYCMIKNKNFTAT
jgi:hypothetical protein